MRTTLFAAFGILVFALQCHSLEKGVVQIYALTEIGTPLDRVTVRIEGNGRTRTVAVHGHTSVELPFGVYMMVCIHKSLATQFKVVRVEKSMPIDVIFGLPLQNPGQVFGEGNFSPFEVAGHVVPPPQHFVFGRIKAVGLFTEDMADSRIDDLGAYRLLLRNEGIYRLLVIYGKHVICEQDLNLTFEMPRYVRLDFDVGANAAKKCKMHAPVR